MVLKTTVVHQIRCPAAAIPAAEDKDVIISGFVLRRRYLHRRTFGCVQPVQNVRQYWWLLCCCQWLIVPALLSAQTTLPAQRELLGISARLLWTTLQHNPQFASLPGTVDCGTYTTGRGSGLGVAVTLEYPLARSLSVGLNASYIPRGGKLTTPNDTEPAFDSTSGQVVSVVTENALDVRLDYLEFAPSVWWTPFTLGRSTIRLDAGLRFGIPLRAEFQQTRRIVSPENAVFISNQQRIINWTGGFQPLTDLQRPTVGVSIGVEHLLPIGSHVHLLQRLGYDHTLSAPVKSVAWSSSGIRLELGIRVWFERPSEPPAPPPPDTATKPTIIEPPPLPTPSVSLGITSFDGHLEEGNELVATLPLVNAVFFEHNSAEIPSRYAQHPSDSIATDDAVAAHRNVLLTIAEILRRNPQSSVILDGATSGDYEGADTLLARRRAEAVARALQALGIPPSRIRTRWAVLPRVPSNMDYPEGRAENQRTDITLVNAPILEYVSKQTFAELQGRLSVHLAGANTQNAEFRLRATGSNEQNVSDTGTYTLPLRLRLDAPMSSVALVAQAMVAGTSLVSVDTLIVYLDTLPHRRVELSTNRFESILRFDYNSSTLTAENRELLHQLVERLPDGTTIEIGGSADVLGDSSRNRKLAQERARATEEFLRSIAGAKQLQIVARGIERRFSDTTPEGRFLNRSIRVTLR